MDAWPPWRATWRSIGILSCRSRGLKTIHVGQIKYPTRHDYSIWVKTFLLCTYFSILPTFPIFGSIHTLSIDHYSAWKSPPLHYLEPSVLQRFTGKDQLDLSLKYIFHKLIEDPSWPGGCQLGRFIEEFAHHLPSNWLI